MFLQWVPGHIGLIGNELADRAANAAATDPDQGDPISFTSARATINRTLRDDIPTEMPIGTIYGAGLDKNFKNMDRRDAVLLAQLRSGHCRRLAAYRAIINPGSDPICPKCREGPQTLPTLAAGMSSNNATKDKPAWEPHPHLEHSRGKTSGSGRAGPAHPVASWRVDPQQ